MVNIPTWIQAWIEGLLFAPIHAWLAKKVNGNTTYDEYMFA